MSESLGDLNLLLAGTRKGLSWFGKGYFWMRLLKSVRFYSG